MWFLFIQVNISSVSYLKDYIFSRGFTYFFVLWIFFFARFLYLASIFLVTLIGNLYTFLRVWVSIILFIINFDVTLRVIDWLVESFLGVQGVVWNGLSDTPPTVTIDDPHKVYLFRSKRLRPKPLNRYFTLVVQGRQVSYVVLEGTAFLFTFAMRQL